MEGLRLALEKKKSYIIAGVIGLLGVLGMLGIDIPNVPVPDNWMLYILDALGLSALRAGIAKIGS